MIYLAAKEIKKKNFLPRILPTLFLGLAFIFSPDFAISKMSNAEKKRRAEEARQLVKDLEEYGAKLKALRARRKGSQTQNENSSAKESTSSDHRDAISVPIGDIEGDTDGENFSDHERFDDIVDGNNGPRVQSSSISGVPPQYDLFEVKGTWARIDGPNGKQEIYIDRENLSLDLSEPLTDHPFYQETAQTLQAAAEQGNLVRPSIPQITEENRAREFRNAAIEVSRMDCLVNYDRLSYLKRSDVLMKKGETIESTKAAKATLDFYNRNPLMRDRHNKALHRVPRTANAEAVLYEANVNQIVQGTTLNCLEGNRIFESETLPQGGDIFSKRSGGLSLFDVHIQRLAKRCAQLDDAAYHPNAGNDCLMGLYFAKKRFEEIHAAKTIEEQDKNFEGFLLTAGAGDIINRGDCNEAILDDLKMDSLQSVSSSSLCRRGHLQRLYQAVKMEYPETRIPQELDAAPIPMFKPAEYKANRAFDVEQRIVSGAQ